MEDSVGKRKYGDCFFEENLVSQNKVVNPQGRATEQQSPQCFPANTHVARSFRMENNPSFQRPAPAITQATEHHRSSTLPLYRTLDSETLARGLESHPMSSILKLALAKSVAQILSDKFQLEADNGCSQSNNYTHNTQSYRQSFGDDQALEGSARIHLVPSNSRTTSTHELRNNGGFSASTDVKNSDGTMPMFGDIDCGGEMMSTIPIQLDQKQPAAGFYHDHPRICITEQSTESVKREKHKKNRHRLCEVDSMQHTARR